MGGYGSGRLKGRDVKATTESQRRIDIRWFKQQGRLYPGATGIVSWSRGGEETGSIRYRAETDRMILDYCYRFKNGEWEPVEQAITFDRTPCHYGGHRMWFRCPRCCKRVAVLYGAGKYFFCRHCYELTYTSQQEDVVDRLIRKARKIRQRLGASNNLTEPILFKPKHMHQKTFDRLRRTADDANNLSWLIVGQRLGLDFDA
ncbi:MAG: hypothetical protein GX087_11120 [Desulfobulbaceae bacterium]|nr:hypothetical protein [Desulfobulbaceae bacterium]